MKIRYHLVVLLISLPVAMAWSAEPREVAWTPLFNGKDLQGWKEHPDHSGHWKAENGAIVGRGEGGGYLFSERGDYESFHLRVEAQVNAAGDGGIYIRSESGLSGKSKSGVYPAGIEVQIRVGGPGKTERTGSLARVRPVNDRLTEPNVWFTLEVIAEGKHIVVKVNDKTTVDFIDGDKTYLKGHIVLQQYTPRTVVKFRKIEIKDLSKGKKDFTGRETTRENVVRELRLLTQPIHRYDAASPDVTDGALFVIAQGTDPEAFLMIEARKSDGAVRWHYALARMNSIALRVDHKGREVWSLPTLAWPTVYTRGEPYTTYRFDPKTP